MEGNINIDKLIKMLKEYADVIIQATKVEENKVPPKPKQEDKIEIINSAKPKNNIL